MIIIQSVLLEAEQHQRQQLEFTFPLLATLERLNEALYDAEDLFDEVLTLVQHKNLMSTNNFSKEITLFFSQYNQIKFAFTKSREIKKIRGVLDDIAQDHSQFGSMMGQGGVRVRASYDSRGNTRETSSLIWEEDVIIGRDDDKRVLIDRLVHTRVKESVCCVSIVGIGGLGKTTLAQLVYNDDTIESEFELKMWVCVSNDFDVKTVLAEILAVATKQSKQRGLNLDQVQTKVQKELDGKKFLLVLDDVWEDVATKWHELRKALMGGKGSRILVTTRSRNVADIVGGQRHELKGLSEAESWNLFETLASKELSSSS